MDIESFSPQTLGLLARVTPDYFSHTGLATLFMSHGLPEAPDAGRVSKQKRVLSVIKHISELGNPRAASVMKSLIEDVVPRFHDTDYTGEGNDPQVMSFVESLHKDGWSIEDGKLVGGSVRVQNITNVAIPEHSRSRTDTVTSRRIFIVHGREKELQQRVINFVRKVQYEPCVLGEVPNLGRTVIEKLTNEAQDVAYAIVLLTPDDEGRLAKAGEPWEPRARQNVMFEWGFLAGLIGRERVVALLREHMDLPSDLQGLACISVKDDSDGWQLRLLREMRAVGLQVSNELI